MTFHAEPPGSGHPAIFDWTRRLRNLFDRQSYPVAVVALTAALTGIAIGLLRTMAGPCASPPVALIRIEVAFRASRFAELLNAESACRAAVVAGFGWDYVFIATYPFLLVALYLWAERWRRVSKPGAPRPDPDAPYWLRGRIFVAAPIIAGLLDAFVENALLWPAALLIRGGATPLVVWLVAIGSIGSALKWILLLVSAWGICSELLSGPRGVVLRRARFSMLAVLLGAVPLLVVPQGQDILQRLAEGADPMTRVFFSVLAIAFAGFAVWGCGRVLMEFRLGGDRAWSQSGWAEYYAEDIPRILGVAVPAIGGAAFAKEAGDILWFAGVAIVGLVVAATLSARLEPIGRAVVRVAMLPKRWLAIPSFAARIGAATIACVIALVLFHRGLPWGEPASLSSDERAIRVLNAAAWFCYLCAWLLYLYVYFRRGRLLVKQDATAAANPAELDDKLTTLRAWSYDAVDFSDGLDRRFVRPIVALTLMSFVALVVFAISPVTVGRGIGPLWVLSIFAANTVFFGSVFVWVAATYGIPIVRLGLVAAVLFGLWNENHPVKTLPQPVAMAIDERKTVTQHLEEWLASPSHAGRQTVPVVLVAAAGGGLRAAYWTAISLAAIQDADTSFASDVFAISGVSGGSVGGALFATLAKDDRADASRKRLAGCASRFAASDSARLVSTPYEACVRAFMRDDFLSPVLAKMIGPDLAQRFFPFAVPGTDRSRGLEASWEDSYAAAVDTTWRAGLLDLARDSAIRTTTPALLLNSTHVETGKRYIATPLKMDDAFADARDVIELLQHDMPVSSAAHNSARFTYVSPAGHLDRGDGQEYGRVVDGGYFENSGLVTLREVYDAIVAWNHDTARLARDSAAHVRRPAVIPIVVYLCNDPLACSPDDSLQKRSADSLARVASTWANEALAPIRGVLNARDARAELARQDLERLVRPNFIQLNVCRDSVRVTTDSARAEKARDRTVSPPLGWLLSALSREWMDASIRSPAAAGEGFCRRTNANGVARLIGRRGM